MKRGWNIHSVFGVSSDDYASLVGYCKDYGVLLEACQWEISGYDDPRDL